MRTWMKKNLMMIMMRILILNLKGVKNLTLTQIPVQNLKLEKWMWIWMQAHLTVILFSLVKPSHAPMDARTFESFHIQLVQVQV